MNAGARSARRLAPKSAWTPDNTICISCLRQLRTASTATATAQSPSSSQQPQSTTAPAVAQSYKISAGVVVSRPPMLTRTLHPFEKAYHMYNRRLNERLALPFTRYFYYKKGTPADVEWKRRAKTRLTPARDIGIYNAYGKEGWNDELLVGDTISEPDAQMEALITDAEGGPVRGAAAREGEGQKKSTGQEVAVQKPLSRRTEADGKGDEASLDRLLERTVYLLVKNKDGRWRFPEDVVNGKEGLHDAAERIIVQAGGINMNTWVVGNAPIGHHNFTFPGAAAKKASDLGEKVFFMKARIMAGQADLSSNVFGYQEMKWLAKEEIEKVVGPHYWSSVKNMLVER